MNKERILELADTIEAEDSLIFNMAEYLGHSPEGGPGFDPYVGSHSHSCQTSACIAGYIWQLKLSTEEQLAAVESSKLKISSTEYFLAGMAYLDITYEEARRLFTPAGFSYLQTIPRDQAVRTLRNLAKTGEIDWRIDQ